MPSSNKAVTNFSSGMFDLKLYGRTDIDQYNNGAKDLTNCIIEWYGGASRTPGTYYVSEVKNSDHNTRLIPFKFSNVQAYVLEFGDLYIRFYKNNGQILSGGIPVEVTTEYTEDEVFDIQYAQTADVMYLVHPNHAPRQLVRTSDTSWTLSDITFTWGPFLDMNTTDITMDAGATTGTDIALVASADYFDAGMNGAFFKMHEGYMKVTSVNDAQNAVVDIIDDLTAHTATTDWYEGAFSTYRGFPSCITFYEDRLVLGATEYQPNTVFLSQPGAYETMETGADDDDAIVETVNARQINKFNWIDASTFLVLGNEGGIVKYWSGSESQPLSPSNKNAKPILSEGCSTVLPVQVGNLVHYIQDDTLTIRALAYSIESDNYVSSDVSLLSRSLIDSAIVQMSYQQSPHSIVWFVTSSGKLLNATINHLQKIIAFAQQEDTGSYKSVATIPVSTYDQTWFIVEREINGVTKKYVEYLMPYDETTQTSLFYVRTGASYNSTATTTITGLDHLEGETVSILADGYVQPNKTVSGGSITLDRSASIVHVGIPYTTKIETLDLNAGSAVGAAIGKPRHISKVWVRLYNSIGGKIGREGYMDDILYEKPSSLFSGLKKTLFPVGWKKEITVRVTQEQPLPLTVTSIYPDMLTND